MAGGAIAETRRKLARIEIKSSRKAAAAEKLGRRGVLEGRPRSEKE